MIRVRLQFSLMRRVAVNEEIKIAVVVDVKKFYGTFLHPCLAFGKTIGSHFRKCQVAIILIDLDTIVTEIVIPTGNRNVHQSVTVKIANGKRTATMSFQPGSFFFGKLTATLLINENCRRTLIIPWISAIKFLDINNDGYLDLLVTGESCVNDWAKSAFLFKNVNGTDFVKIEAGLQGICKSGIDWCDLNGDGFVDFVYSGESDKAITIISYNNGDGTFKLDSTSYRNRHSNRKPQCPSIRHG